MTLVTPTQVNPGDDITANSVNAPINEITAVVNGNIDDTNISSVGGSKLSAGTVPESAMVTPRGFAHAVVSVTSTGAGSVTGLSFEPRFAIFFSTLTSSNVTASSSMHSWDGSNVYNVSSSTRPAASSGAGSRASTASAVNIFSINSGGSIVAECVFTPSAFTSDGFTYTVGTSSANVSVFAILFG